MYKRRPHSLPGRRDEWQATLCTTNNFSQRRLTGSTRRLLVEATKALLMSPFLPVSGSRASAPMYWRHSLMSWYGVVYLRVRRKAQKLSPNCACRNDANRDPSTALTWPQDDHAKGPRSRDRRGRRPTTESQSSYHRRLPALRCTQP